MNRTKLFTILCCLFLSLGCASNSSAQTIAYTGPLENNANSIRSNCSAYKPYGPFVARAVVLTSGTYNSRITDLEFLKNNPGTCPTISDYRVAFGSITDMKTLLTPSEITRLKNIGVTTLMYNPEGGHTPSDPTFNWPNGEFAARFMDSTLNPIAQLGQFAQANGFDSVWIPLREDADNNQYYANNSSVIKKIYGAGIDGLGLQEQRFIETQCVVSRMTAAENTISKHETAAGKPLEITLQVMSERCAAGDSLMASCNEGTNTYTYQHCDQFIDELEFENIPDIIAMWPALTNDTLLIQTLRAGSSTTPTSTPPSPRPGDTNGDGNVNLSDLSTLLSNFGKSGQALNDGDFNRDGNVNLSDLSTLLSNFGQ